MLVDDDKIIVSCYAEMNITVTEPSMRSLSISLVLGNLLQYFNNIYSLNMYNTLNKKHGFFAGQKL